MRRSPSLKRHATLSTLFVALVATLAGCSRSQAAPAAAVDVSVGDHGYAPSSITIAQGQPTAVQFTRTTDHTCAREVIFPDLGIKEELPLGTPVRVTLPAGAAKTYTFQCGMGMYKGSVVVL